MSLSRSQVRVPLAGRATTYVGACVCVCACVCVSRDVYVMFVRRIGDECVCISMIASCLCVIEHSSCVCVALTAFASEDKLQLSHTASLHIEDFCILLCVCVCVRVRLIFCSNCLHRNECIGRVILCLEARVLSMEHTNRERVT